MDVPMVSMVVNCPKEDSNQQQHGAPQESHLDQEQLSRMGKKQVLRRNFGFISMLSFSCTVLVTWEGVLVLFAPGFINGGPGAMVFQFILIWGGTLSTFVAIAEMASMAPTAGGQYHWVCMLSPKKIRNFMSYITGWMTILAWVSTVTTGGFAAASIIQITAFVNHQDDYVPERYQSTLLTWAVLLAAVLFNTIVSSTLPKVEAIFMIVHVLGFFAILIPLVYFAPHGKAAEIFSTFLNEGQWATYGLSWMVGLLGFAFSFVGADAAVHMSEEIVNPAMNVPRSIVGSIIINGMLGLGMLFAVLFCLGDADAVLEAQNELGFGFIEIFLNATDSTAAATGMIAIVIVLSFSCTVGFLATASRMIWSFARDHGLPFSNLLSTISRRTTVPYWAVIVAAVIPMLLVIINVGSITAFNQVVSMSLVGFYSTYFLSCILLLYNRLRGYIRPHNKQFPSDPAHLDLVTGDYVLTWGPWHVPGMLGVMNNVLACSYLIVLWFFGFWPTTSTVEPSTMNYASLVFGIVVLYSILYYATWGRKKYTGPIVEISQ